MKASEMTNKQLAYNLEATILHLSEETLACTVTDDILREAAARLRRPTPVDDDLLKMARDIEKMNAKLKVAEDALQKIFNKVFVDCEVAEIAKDALAAIRGEGGAI